MGRRSHLLLLGGGGGVVRCLDAIKEKSPEVSISAEMSAGISKHRVCKLQITWRILCGSPGV